MKKFSADMKMLWHGFSFVSYIGLAMLVVAIFLIYMPPLWWSGFHPITTINLGFGLMILSPMGAMISSALSGWYLRTPNVFLCSAKSLCIPVIGFILILPLFTLRSGYSYTQEMLCLIGTLLVAFGYILLSKKLFSLSIIVFIIIIYNSGKLFPYYNNYHSLYFYTLLMMIIIDALLILNLKRFMCSSQLANAWLYPTILESDTSEDIRSCHKSTSRNNSINEILLSCSEKFNLHPTPISLPLTTQEKMLSQALGPIYFPASGKATWIRFAGIPLLNTMVLFIAMMLFTHNIVASLTEVMTLLVFLSTVSTRLSNAKSDINKGNISLLPGLADKQQWRLLNQLIAKYYVCVLIIPFLILSAIGFLLHQGILFVCCNLMITVCVGIAALSLELLLYTNKLGTWSYFICMSVISPLCYGGIQPLTLSHPLSQPYIVLFTIVLAIISLGLYRLIFKYVSKRPHPWLLN